MLAFWCKRPGQKNPQPRLMIASPATHSIGSLPNMLRVLTSISSQSSAPDRSDLRSLRNELAVVGAFYVSALKLSARAST